MKRKATPEKEAERVEKKRLRVIRNRQSAQESRNRQKKYVADLENMNNDLRRLNEALIERMKILEQQNLMLLQKFNSSNPTEQLTLPEPMVGLDLKTSLVEDRRQSVDSEITSPSWSNETVLGFDDLFSSESVYSSPPTLSEAITTPDFLDDLFKPDSSKLAEHTALTIDDFFKPAEQNYTTTFAIPEISIKDSKLLSFPEVEVTSLKKMNSSRVSLMSQTFSILAPTILLVCCSQMKSSLSNQRLVVNEARWNAMLARKYPICYDLLVNK
jgi:hypothetical protein